MQKVLYSGWYKSDFTEEKLNIFAMSRSNGLLVYELIDEKINPVGRTMAEIFSFSVVK